MQTLPYGEWPSPISAGDVARSGVGIGAVCAVADEVWWTETRPTEDGRATVVRRRADGSTSDALPRHWHARTRVHEYGGRAWLPLPAGAGGGLVFANWDDQRLYLLPEGSDDPLPLTPEPDEPAALRYAEPVLAPGREVLVVRERHEGALVTRQVVAVPLDGRGATDAGAVREVLGGSDFLAHPRVSPDGTRIAWVAWDHPRMPWDGTELRVADLVDGVAGAARTVLGGPEESVLQPEWVDDDTLYAVSDRTGWWNLYRLRLGDRGPVEPEPLHPAEEEFGFPHWLLGMTSYAVLPDGRIAVIHGTGSYRLGILDPASGELVDLDLPFSVVVPWLQQDNCRLVTTAASATESMTVVRVDPADGSVERLRAGLTQLPDPAYLPEPTSEALPGPDGRVVHAHVHRPRNPDAAAPEGTRPPYLVFVHGGPTGQAFPVLNLGIAFFTSRGIGVIDVDYGGSAGYGREYRQLLDGQWGVVDVEDCVTAARVLVGRGEADGARIAIRGGSAGGWTTLAALTRTDFFAAGTSFFGVADLLSFAEDTHDFESRYLDGLIGPLPDAREVYVERAPINHVDDLSCPVLLLQGSDDQVVPRSQSLMFRDALAAKGIPHAYLEFEGEQHGFRKAESIIDWHQAELSFYGQVLGFDPPGVPVLELQH